MWEDGHLLGTIFVRWRRKQCLHCCSLFCFFFPMGLCYFVLISYFEFWTRVFFMRLFLMDLLTVRHRILVKFSYTILEDGFFANL